MVIPGVTFSPTCRSTSAAIAPALRIEVISSDVRTKGRIEGPGSPESAYGGRVIALGTPLLGLRNPCCTGGKDGGTFGVLVFRFAIF